MKTILLDVDGVLCDFVSGYLTLVYEETGRQFEHHHVTQFDLKRALGLSDTESASVAQRVQQPGFCAGLAPLPGAVDGVRLLQEVADVYIVTSPWNSNPTWTHEREKWLAAHFGIHHSHVLHGSAKHLVVGDVFIDDRAETIVKWNAAHPGKTAVLWETPWNAGNAWPGVLTNDWTRVRTLVEVLK